MNILFVCKANRFRSKVAEALFKKYHKSRDFKVKSAGVEINFMNPTVPINVKKALAEYNVEVENEISQPMDDVLLRWPDLFVVVADNVSSDDFPEEKVERWEIKDADENSPEEIKAKIRKIDRKVKELVKRLEE